MANLYYSIMPIEETKGTVSSIAKAQKDMMLSQINATKYQKDTRVLEQRLNDFFYSKTSQDALYNRAIQLAEQEFNKRWGDYNFELDANKLTASTAKLQQSGIQFINKNSDLQTIKNTVNAISSYFSNFQPSGRLQSSLAKVQQITASSPWKDVREVNAIVASILYGNKTVYGEAFEIPLAAFGALVDEGIEATEDDLLKHFVAQVRSSTSIDISGLSESDRKQLKFSRTIPINEGLTLQFTNPTQDKVDVTFILNDIDYNISAKSYSSVYKDIHILGGTSLAVPTLNLSSNEFVSSYLSHLFYPRMNLKQIHDALQLNILFMALSGEGTGQTDSADVMVLNDKASKKIYVRNVSQIVNSIIQSKNWGAVKFTNTIAGIPDKSIRNFSKRQPNSKVAIPEIINALHAQKLSVSIKGTAVRDSIKF